MDDRIEREVQRRVASVIAESNRQITALQEHAAECKNVIVQQHALIRQFTSESFHHGIILHVQNEVDASQFNIEDEVLVIDENHPYYNLGGNIVGPYQKDVDTIPIRLHDVASTVIDLHLNQIRLSIKDDGSWAIVLIDGKHWEVKNVAGMNLVAGDTVKVNGDKKIVGPGFNLESGPICHVASVHENGIEINEKGEKRFIYNPHKYALNIDDRVVVDGSFSIIMRTLPREDTQRYRISEPTISWDDIGGLEEAKQQVRSAIELPYCNPEIFAHYNSKRVKGILLYGTPGNGKTLLARAAAASLAKLHGKNAVESGYRYFKSPELLDKWIGNTERTIRMNFEDARLHYKKYGYPAIHVYDEADAIMPQRGVRRSSDIADTIVPMFLGEMDGVDEQENKANPLIFLLSNRADTLDPAIIRPGRISRHIRIESPNMEAALNILQLHARDMPFQNENHKRTILTIVATDLFSKKWLLYRVNNQLDFTLGDAVSGAMLASIVEDAKDMAIQRDLQSGVISGVDIEDFRKAIERVFHQQIGMNHSYQLAEFAEKHGLQPNHVSIERIFGAA